MNNRDKMLQRLRILKDPKLQDPITLLKNMGLVSYQYDFRNLATDQWYLRTREGRRKCEYIVDPNDPLKGLWLGCLIMAISDVCERRPCDLNAWKYDSPPMGIDTCSPTVHICAPAALGFLLSLSEEQEQLGGLRPGTVRNIIRSRA